ncbi:MAG: CBS domain-containing protein [Planctomycetota bacterium]
MPLQHPTIADVMTHHAESVTMDDTVLSVLNLFERRGFHHVIVLDRDECVGVLSDRDLLATISPFVGTKRSRSMDEFTANRRVHQVMTRRVLTIEPEAPAAEACRLMVERDIHCLPVVSGTGAVIGIVTADDLLQWIAHRFDELDDLGEAA